MKTIILLLLVLVTVSGCKVICPGGPVTERDIQRHDKKKFRVHQRVKELSDGYWYVTTQRGYTTPTALTFQCRPDSQMLADLTQPGGEKPYIDFLKRKIDGN